MVWENASFWLLVLLCGAIYAIALPAQKAVREAEKELTADELKTFRDHYAKRSSKSDMPMKFDPLAAAQRRASRIWLTGCIAVIVAISWIIYAGPTLGLFQS